MDKFPIPVERPPIEFWFDFGSNYSYISAMRIEDAAQRAGMRVVWRPFLLGPIFRSFGWSTSPFVLQKEKGAYVWRDMERQCASHDIPWMKPSVFPRAAVLPLRVALAADRQIWVGEFCRRIMALNFVADREIDTPDTVAEVLGDMGLSVQLWLDAAQSPDNKLRLRTQTELAQARGIFGAPTFLVGDEMFWGDDRLDAALAWGGARAV